VIAREQKMVLKNMRLERSKANGMIVVFILFGSVMNCCLAEAQKLQKSTAKQKQGGGQDTGERQRQKGGGQKGGLFRLLDINRDEMLSEAEINNAFNVLKMLDVNRNGVLDPQELVMRGGGSGKVERRKER